MSRLESTFADMARRGRGGLITYATAGDPNRTASTEILIALAKCGADVLEVGVPFSDPLADGPVIQRASERALAGGTTLRGALDVVRAVRAAVETPIVLFTYANPVVRMDPTVFARTARDAGVDGVLILDYPVEESEPLRAPLIDAGLDPIYLIGPTTTDERIRQSGKLGCGFLYVISRMGVTGVRDSFDGEVGSLIARVRAQSSLPVALGFGISSPEHVAQACRTADAAVVGSALVQVIADHGSAPDVAHRAGEYVRWLKSNL
jgi:tryptophan synthase alpha chain